MRWFKHSGTLRDDPRLLFAERKVGALAYPCFCRLLETATQYGGSGAGFNPRIDMNHHTDEAWLASQLRIPPEELRGVLEVFAEVGLIDQSEFTQRVIFLPAMTEMGDEYTSARQRKLDSSPRGDQKRVDKSREEEKETLGTPYRDTPDSLPTQSEQTPEYCETTEQRAEQLRLGPWKSLGIEPCGGTDFISRWERFFAARAPCELNGTPWQSLSSIGLDCISGCQFDGAPMPASFVEVIRRRQDENERGIFSERHSNARMSEV